MPKTVLELTAQEWQAYQPSAQLGRLVEMQSDERRQAAWQVARQAARVLRQEFGASRIVVFGSLPHRSGFNPWSDIDLAAWGIPADRFYRAVAVITGLSPDFKIDLLDLETCKPALRQIAEREGVDL